MLILSHSPMSRRSLVASMLATALIGPTTAFAQSVTDQEKTDLLRNGLTPHGPVSDDGDAPRPSYGGAPRPSYGHAPRPDYDGGPRPSYGGEPPRSRIPADEPLIVHQDDQDYRVLIDPYTSAEFNIPFDWDSAELSPFARRQLATLGELLQSDLKPYRYLVAGHTDATGGFQYNMALSMRRALSVRECLIQSYGVESRRLFVAGLGSTALRDPSRPFWGGNRRVEIVLVRKFVDR